MWTPEQLSRELNEAANIKPNVDQVLRKGAHNIKTSASASASGYVGAHASGYPHSIEYKKSGDLEYLIEPQGKSQGEFGAILEHGGVHSPPHNDFGQALEAEEPNLQKHLEREVVKKLW